MKTALYYAKSLQSILVAECLVLQTSDHEVSGWIPLEVRFFPNQKGALHCTEPFMFIIPSWNTVERDIKPKLIHPSLKLANTSSSQKLHSIVGEMYLPFAEMPHLRNIALTGDEDDDSRYKALTHGEGSIPRQKALPSSGNEAPFPAPGASKSGFKPVYDWTCRHWLGLP